MNPLSVPLTVDVNPCQLSTFISISVNNGVAMDASADLTELGRTPVAVVCAGVKSILDIGRTLEFLETQGVTVATFGSTSDFPVFFTRTSGFQVRCLGAAIDFPIVGVLCSDQINLTLAREHTEYAEYRDAYGCSQIDR